MATPAYPASRYAPTRPIDLASKDERARLTTAALKGFFRLMTCWKVRDQDARQLLGGVTNGPYYEMKRHPEERVLDADKLLRISYLLGIFQALNMIHSKALADEWITLPNSNRIFAGATPLAYLLHEGLPGMATVRQLLDARQTGL